MRLSSLHQPLFSWKPLDKKIPLVDVILSQGNQWSKIVGTSSGIFGNDRKSPALAFAEISLTAVFFNRQSLDLYISSFVGYFKKTNPFVLYFICFNNVIVHDQCFLSLHKLKTKRGFVKHLLTFRLNNWPLISLLTLRKSGQVIYFVFIKTVILGPCLKKTFCSWKSVIGDETTCRVIDENFAWKKKKATAYLSRELSKARYNSFTGGKKQC